MDNLEKIRNIQKEILELFRQKENTGSQKHFDKCIEKIYIKERELLLLGAKSPLNK